MEVFREGVISFVSLRFYLPIISSIDHCLSRAHSDDTSKLAYPHFAFAETNIFLSYCSPLLLASSPMLLSSSRFVKSTPKLPIQTQFVL